MGGIEKEESPGCSAPGNDNFVWRLDGGRRSASLPPTPALDLEMAVGVVGVRPKATATTTTKYDAECVGCKRILGEESSRASSLWQEDGRFGGEGVSFICFFFLSPLPLVVLGNGVGGTPHNDPIATCSGGVPAARLAGNSRPRR